MKTIYLLSVLFVFTIYSLKSQILFHEDCETLDSVVSIGSPGFTQTINWQYSGNSSVWGQFAIGDSALLITNSFSTLGYNKVWLTFNHICKIEFFDAATIWVSTNNRISWTQLTNTEYLGSASFPNNEFKETAYVVWAPGLATTPTNAWFHYEGFDISTLAANANSVKIMFKLLDDNLNGMNLRTGWIIDDIQIEVPNMSFIPTQASNNDNNLMSIHPNPTKDLLEVAVHLQTPQPITFQLLDLNGKLKFSAQLLSNEKDSVSIETLANGIYIA